MKIRRKSNKQNLIEAVQVAAGSVVQYKEGVVLRIIGLTVHATDKIPFIYLDSGEYLYLNQDTEVQTLDAELIIKD